MKILFCSIHVSRKLTYTNSNFVVSNFLIDHLGTNSELYNALGNPPRQRTEVRYIQWIAETKDKVEYVLHLDPAVPRLLLACMRHLEVKYWISNFFKCPPVHMFNLHVTFELRISFFFSNWILFASSWFYLIHFNILYTFWNVYFLRLTCNDLMTIWNEYNRPSLCKMCVHAFKTKCTSIRCIIRA